jgi:hypothetical protein
MTSKIEIYNRALARIGIDQFISDPNENSKQGNLYRLMYDYCVDQCLADFPWGFATTIIPEAKLDGDAPAGWQYKYAYPVDCLSARQITDACGARTVYTTFLQYHWDCGGLIRQANRPTPWKVMSETTGTANRKFIATDMPNAYLLYTKRITDPNQFDQGFIDAVSWRIAMEIAPPFFGGPQGASLAVTLGNQYRNALLTARAQALNESGQDYTPDPESIAARR